MRCFRNAPDAWYCPWDRQDRLRDQLQPVLLQARAVADAGRDQGRHSGPWRRKLGDSCAEVAGMVR